MAWAAGEDPGPAADMSRLRPDGEPLSRRLTAPRTGVLPFLIDWGGTDHPAIALIARLDGPVGPVTLG
ncbi:hypothetical protein ACGFNU_30580 [Spirillospora sp. NPDC048911]|uniref:hypothetical protein n=1 Tax=Spirillospora sp. NPDC048911 TaxID=3364527 RepID=UPI00371407F7